MQRPVCLALLVACLAGCQAVDHLDPASTVEALSAAGAGGERWKRPEFCGELDCPPFSKKERTDNFELRKYEGGKWVQTSVNGSKFEIAYTKAASRLLKYFKGSNSEKQTFDITTPTLCALTLEKGGESTEKMYNFSLWIPEEMQRDTPQPIDAELKVIQYPAVEVYVRIFGGFATEGTILDETKGLMELLDEEGRDFEHDGVVFAAVYDPPQKLMKRHNEIHIPAGKKPSFQLA